ncbi:hypothetical protein [Butyrivibrio sp. AE3006]|uniref:hypothetical protein n=1 Tax=Butyrivibrio sp. AE3006 TaxID=1280673 RepID=UPI0003FADD35|nr:hypothetical protein [Butyrivibrio sp. AE3006]
MRAVNFIFQKIRRRNGESLAETLVATLIAAMSMMVLAGALVSSAKANKAADDISSFAMNGASVSGQVVFKNDSNSKSYTVDINSKQQESGKETRKVYYYEIH